MADFLFLNASNLPARPIYPYAFIQVGALLRRAGIEVAYRDFLGIEPHRYTEVLARLIAAERPRAVGLTLRQGDSLVLRDYEQAPEHAYQPVEDTRRLVRALREVTDAPVVLGGMGFTTNPDALFQHIGADFGITGEPDELVARFDEVLVGHTEGVGNLVYRERGLVRRNPRRYHGPLDEREYDESVVARLEQFYGRPRLYGARAEAVAVEIARGCPYRCYFCTEPQVKGRKVRERDLDAVMADVEFLRSKGIRRFWMVCSEINVGRPDLALRIAQRFRRVNEQGSGPTLRWHAYHLPRWLSRSDLQELYDSGFAGGWNDFPSLDDANLRAVGVPYRTQDIVHHIGNTLDLAPAEAQDTPPHFSAFLGNAYSTPRSVATTLQHFEHHGFAERFATAVVSDATRLFPFGRSREAVPDGVELHTFSARGREVHRSDELERVAVEPTFYFPEAISSHLGSPEAVRRFFEYVETTFLSRSYERSLDMGAFVASSASVEWLADRIASRVPHEIRLPIADDERREQLESLLRDLRRDPEETLESLLPGRGRSEADRTFLARFVVHRLRAPLEPQTLAVLRYLGLSPTKAGVIEASPLAVTTTLLSRYDSRRALFEDLRARFGTRRDGHPEWSLRTILFLKNVRLDPRYRELLLPDRDPPHRRPSIPARPSSPRPMAGLH